MTRLSTGQMRIEIERGLRTYKAFAQAEELVTSLGRAEEETRNLQKQAAELRDEVATLTAEKAELLPRVEALKNAEESNREAQQYAVSVKTEADEYSAKVRAEADAEAETKRQEADTLAARIKAMRDALGAVTV